MEAVDLWELIDHTTGKNRRRNGQKFGKGKKYQFSYFCPKTLYEILRTSILNVFQNSQAISKKSSQNSSGDVF